MAAAVLTEQSAITTLGPRPVMHKAEGLLYGLPLQSTHTACGAQSPGLRRAGILATQGHPGIHSTVRCGRRASVAISRVAGGTRARWMMDQSCWRGSQVRKRPPWMSAGTCT